MWNAELQMCPKKSMSVKLCIIRDQQKSFIKLIKGKRSCTLTPVEVVLQSFLFFKKQIFLNSFGCVKGTPPQTVNAHQAKLPSSPAEGSRETKPPRFLGFNLNSSKHDGNSASFKLF